MQFSESWLRSLCNPPLDSEQLAHILTMAGLEVEAMRPVAPAFDRVVVAHIVSCEKHPDADRLNLCQVDTGEHGVLSIVCGAPNAAAGLVVPCALVGARLPGVEIKKAKVRGIESSGMLCSAKELGIAEEAAGLLVLPQDAPIGSDIRQYLNLDDQLITLKLTPNRADCLSLTGIAREVAALTGAPLTLPEASTVSPTLDAVRAVNIEAPAACPRYCGRLIRGVDGSVATPDWMRRRLERCGIRSISALVDVTNYVMLELGQPLHAFDDAKLQGAIRVRLPMAGEQLQLLNGQTITLPADAVLIADQSAALALGGIMGGELSGVTAATRDIFLESAFFAPDAIAGKARALGFTSDSSFRFERGVDFQLQRQALERASQLVIDICGGQAGPIVEAQSPEHLPVCRPVRLRTARASKVLGVEFSTAQISQLISGLGFEFRQEGDEFLVTPPSHRFDMEIEEDLIEELARLHGYDNIPAHPPRGLVTMMPLPEDRRTAMQLRRLLAGRGYRETVNFSFVDAVWEADFCANPAPITLANPIASQMGVMRSSLIGSLVGVLATNLKRQQSRVRIFELGRCFLRDNTGTPVAGFRQPQRLAALAAGPALAEQWGAPTRPVDFFDLKADVESLYPGRSLRCEKLDHPALHPGRAASIWCGERQVGLLGELHPRWVQKYELGTAPVVCELELDALLEQSLPTCGEVSRFPGVVRDLALIVDQHQPWQGLLDALRGGASTLVKDIQLFDVYQGQGIAEGRKSLAFRVVIQDTQRTLEDLEVEEIVAALVSAAERHCGAELRR
ncbi:phenylalanine--tRNA ligase subunit beta [Denitratisoma oestradiolicum]|uniref:Phenylalanine--tRNA ligase beta subunit n=1 Tax=Denitratisoma oestradiolicum TaxID=311182 RepID=A0A6S6Y485_9PROT|nr:phenylalanine--tRNA ligase subunit beta [Denitratisoma oestradiolicum]TWO80352.1 phenylalanine--tRNA ligase subunit beta [Denitratisoma oestradiolicum]CAB1370150.1 phenylalanine tRNA synthetase, beta subunit [Denitratisoma oestradiolicum]